MVPADREKELLMQWNAFGAKIIPFMRNNHIFFKKYLILIAIQVDNYYLNYAYFNLS